MHRMAHAQVKHRESPHLFKERNSRTKAGGLNRRGLVPRRQTKRSTGTAPTGSVGALLWRFKPQHGSAVSHLCVLTLTAGARGLVGRVAAVTGLVAHLLHADTLPAATLKQGGALTHVHCEEPERERERERESERERRAWG